MKSIKLSLLALCIMLGANAFAQFGYGAMGGLTLAKMNFDGATIDSKMRTNFTLGGFASYEILDFLDIKAGLMYSGRGTKVEPGGGAADDVIKLGYLNIPIHAEYKYEITSDNYIRAFAGPYLAYALSVKASDGVPLNGIKRFDFGLDLGAGYQYGPFLADIMYSFGLTNILSDDDAPITAKNGVFTIAVGYVISGADY